MPFLRPGYGKSQPRTSSRKKHFGRTFRSKLKLLRCQRGSGYKVSPAEAPPSVTDEFSCSGELFSPVPMQLSTTNETSQIKLRPTTQAAEEESIDCELDDNYQYSNDTPTCGQNRMPPTSPQNLPLLPTGPVRLNEKDVLSCSQLHTRAQEEDKGESIDFGLGGNTRALSKMLPQISAVTTECVSDTLYPMVEEETKDDSTESVDEQISCEAELVGILAVNSSIQQNLNGLEKLLRATKVTEYLESEKNIVAKVIVFGGDEGLPTEELRRCIKNFVSAGVTDGDASLSSLSSLVSTEEMPSLFDRVDDDDYQTASRAGLHTLSLQLVVNSLRLVLLSSRGAYPESINFWDPFWVQVVRVLVYNVETRSPTHEDDIATLGCTLKCIRLLHSLEPTPVEQLVRHSLLPYILYLKEYGETHRLHAIAGESSRLLRRAKIKHKIA